MSINASVSGRTVRFSLKGVLALGSDNGSLARAVRTAIDTGARTIEIDATGVRFLDAAGLGELVGCRAMAERAGVELRLCGMSRKVRDLLRITSLDRRLLAQADPLKSPHGFRWRVA